MCVRLEVDEVKCKRKQSDWEFAPALLFFRLLLLYSEMKGFFTVKSGHCGGQC